MQHPVLDEVLENLLTQNQEEQLVEREDKSEP